MIQRAVYPGLALTEPAALAEPPAPAGLRRKWTVLVVLLAAPFLAVLDAFVVLVAVPSIQDQLHASDAGVQLVVAGYGVTYAAFLIAGGRLGDIHGRRKLLVVGLGLFAVTSLLSAAAHNEDVLILARVLQGAPRPRSCTRKGWPRSGSTSRDETWARRWPRSALISLLPHCSRSSWYA